MSVEEPKQYIDVLKDLGEATSCHGIPKVISSRQLAVKVLWCLLLLGTMSLFTIQFMGLYDEFISYPIKTSVSLKFSSLQLPAITLCNMNPAKKSVLQNFSKLNDIIEVANLDQDNWFEQLLGVTNITDADLLDIFYNYGDYTPPEDVYEDDYEAPNGDPITLKHDSFELWRNRVLMEYKKLSTAEKRQLGHQYKDLVYHLKFAGIELPSFPFTEIETTEYGICYTIDHPFFVAKSTGPFDGLNLILNIEIDEYVEQLSSGYGIRMVVHDPGTTPLPEREGITLNPNFETNIGLRLVEVNRIGGDYGDCVNAEHFEQYKHIKYTVPFCYAICQSERIWEICNCVPLNSPDSLGMNETICNVDNIEDIFCIIDVTKKIQNGQIECKCKSRCVERTFGKTVSGRTWPHAKYMKHVLMKDTCSRNMTSMENLCRDFESSIEVPPRAYQNFLSVNIYYEDLNYETITEEPLYPFIRFLSDIGGAMGLYMGASVLTYVELFQLALETILYLRYKKNGRTDVMKFGPKGSK